MKDSQASTEMIYLCSVKPYLVLHTRWGPRITWYDLGFKVSLESGLVENLHWVELPNFRLNATQNLWRDMFVAKLRVCVRSRLGYFY